MTEVFTVNRHVVVVPSVQPIWLKIVSADLVGCELAQRSIFCGQAAPVWTKERACGFHGVAQKSIGRSGWLRHHLGSDVVYRKDLIRGILTQNLPLYLNHGRVLTGGLAHVWKRLIFAARYPPKL
jgi:hypothetical protein